MKYHFFNPEHDLALATFSPYFIPPRSARQMAVELSPLPAWWASAGDVVCVDAPEAIRCWAENEALCLPGVEWGRKDRLPSGAMVTPWGWNPLLVRQLQNAGVGDALLPDADSLCRMRDAAHRRHAVELLAWLRSEASVVGREWRDWLCGTSVCCTDEAGIVSCLTAWPDALLKAPWSGSGKGLRRGRGGYVPPLVGWCRRLLREQGGVIVEPVYNKVYDFAMEFESDGEGQVVYKGLSCFLTNGRGAYVGNRVVAEEEHLRWLSSYVPLPLWQALRDELARWLSRAIGCIYRGPLGVDMMLCRVEGRETLCVHPCVEVNLRCTMGWVAMSLARMIASGKEARFAIDYCAAEGELWHKHCADRQACPARTAGGKLTAGYMPLTPVAPYTHYRAALWVV